MKLKWILILFLLMIYRPTHADTIKKEWVHFVKDNLFDHYYDKISMNRLPQGIIQLVVKVAPRGKKGFDLLMGVRKQKGFLMGGYENYAYTLKAIEINCRNKTRNTLDHSDYNDQGALLDSVRAVRRRWVEIAPESIDDFYHKAICKKKEE